MASIRRTLSPAHHDRMILNSGATQFSPLSISSPLPKAFPNSAGDKWFSSHPLSFLARVLAVVFVQKSSRKGGWRRPFYRCLLCFLLGILLGVMLFGRMEDSRVHDYFSVEIKPQHINARLDEGNADVAKSKGGEVVVDTVSFGVMTRVADKILARFDFVPRKHIIVVTPTFNRAMQAYYLNRLSQTLRLVQPPLLWIVVETNTASFETAEMLRRTGVMYRHLVCKNNMKNVKDAGVHQRNTALEHIELHRLDGIVYFADENNIYSLELFESLREIRRFGTWPVAMLAPGKSKAIMEGPACNGSQVIGWHTNEKSKRFRRFHVDMSGFAFNSTILWDPKRWHRPFLNPIRQLDTLKEGFQETSFIEQLVEDESQMEGTPNGCSRMLNWHLNLQVPSPVHSKGWQLQKNLEADIPLQ